MQSRRRKLNRGLAAAAAVLVACGSLLVVEGSASATVPIVPYPAIRLWNRYEVATLALPAKVPCPRSQPDCKWKLTVFEPDVSGQPSVGAVVGDAGTLTVTYPEYFCGVLEAEAFVGPSPWILQRELEQQVDTGGACGHGTSANTSSVATTTPASPTTAAAAVPAAATSPLSPTATTSSPAAVPVGVTATTVIGVYRATVLPFTGADVRPLAFVGGVLVLLGIYILTTLEQRRRAMRRMSHAVRSSPATGHATRVTRWFLGD